MNQAKPPAAPRGLGKRGRAFWKVLQAENEFDGPGTEVLIEACRTLDRLEALDEVISEQGVTALGSTGQVVVHPAVSESRQLQVVLTRLVDALALPLSEEDERAGEAWRVDRAKRASAASHGYLKAVK